MPIPLLTELSLMKNTFYFASFKDLLAINIFSESWESTFPFTNNSFEQDDIFLVCKGDAVLTDHLRLDIDEGWESDDKKWIRQFPGLKAQQTAQSIEGLIVLGNLSVKGCIINEEGDYGALLYVAGQVSCQSLVAGGSTIIIQRDITAEEVIISHYNHGHLKCNGLASSAVLIIYDHYTYIEKHDTSLFYYNDKTGESPVENDCYEDEETDEDWLCSPNLTRLLANPVKSFDHLILDLNEGEYVLATANMQPKDEAYWLKKSYRHWSNLSRIPNEFKTPPFFKKVYEKYGAVCFPYFPVSFITTGLCKNALENNGINLRYIPAALITKELCFVAARHQTLIPFIPAQFLDYALTKEVILFNKQQMENVPLDFITEELLVEYVKEGRGLWLDRYCKQAEISKEVVLFKVLDAGITYIENIWGFHFQPAVYFYAKDLYDKPAYAVQWAEYVQRFKAKIDRLDLLP